ncbi:MAG TPA: molecular chaperone DnaJ [Acidimicrobiales bacterium]|nr:molecular chaperone DnaJ [Acidimicrobiales bacterium]
MAQASREWFEKDYYKVLGVAEDATERDIQRAYRKLAKQYHPDANPGDKGAEEKFKEANTAHDVLSDPEKRKEYDEIRRLGPMAGAGFGGAPGAGGAGGGFGGSFRVDDLGDLLGGLFGRGRTARGRSGGGGGAAGAVRGDDLEAELHLDFDAAVHGATTTVSVVSDVTCHTCHGSGAAPGTSPVICPVCSGRGVVDDNQGFFSFSTPCRACRGTGMRVETPCPTCHGTGVERRPRNVKVRVPAGVQDGQRIRVAGRGAAGHNGGPAGDLYVVCRVGQHELFGRKGRDLTLTVPISFAEAALGATVTVPTLEKAVTLKVPAGTRSGRTFRVRGKGVAENGSKSAGDLLVTVEVAVPEHLSEAEREAVEKLAAAQLESPRSYLGKWIDGDQARA